MYYVSSAQILVSPAIGLHQIFSFFPKEREYWQNQKERSDYQSNQGIGTIDENAKVTP